MAQLERKDLISDEALQAPLILQKNFESLLASVSKVISEFSKHEQAVSGAKSTTKLKEETEALTLEQQELIKVQNQISIAMARNNEEYANAQKELQKVRSELKEKTKETERDSRTVNAQNASIKELGQALGKNRAAYAALRTEQERNSKDGKALLKIIQQQDTDYKKLSSSIGQNQANVGNYTQAIKDALGPLGSFSTGLGSTVTSLGGVTQGMTGATTASGVLRAALIAIPIFALIAGITALISYFKGTEDGAQKLRIIMAVVSEVFSGFVDVVIGLGRELSNLTLDKVKDSFKEMGETIKNFVLSRIELLISGVKGIGTAFGLLFEGEFKQAAKAAGQALLDINRAVNPLFIAGEVITNVWSEATEAVKGFYENVKSDALAAIELAKRENQLIVDRRKFLVEEEVILNKLNTAKKNITDQTLSLQERLQAVRDAEAALEELEGRRVDLKSRELAIARERAALGETDEATLDHIAQLEKELLQITNNRLSQQKELVAQGSGLEKQIQAERIKHVVAFYNAEYQGAKENLDKKIDLVKQEVIEGKKTKEQGGKEINDLERSLADDYIQIQIDKVKKILDIEGLSAEERAKMEVELAKLKENLQDAYYNQVMEPNKKSELDFLAEIQEAYNAFGNAVMTIVDGITERKIQNIDRELEALEEQTKKELELAGDNDKAKAKIEEDAAKRREELEEQKAKAQRKAAIFGKALSVVQAGIDTAGAILKALNTVPPASFVLAAITAGLAAVQTAAIAAAPIPAFKDGGVTKTNVILAGEEGSELYRTPSGVFGLTPDEATVMSLPKGTRIYNREDTVRMLALKSLSDGMHDSTQQSKEDDSLMRVYIRNQESLERTIRNKKEVHINFSRRGAEAVIQSAEMRNKILNDFYR